LKQKILELEFDLRGNLKPYEVIEITIEEFEKNFVTYQAKIVCNMDAYMVIEYPKKSKNYIFTKSNTLYWLNQFGRTRKSRTGRRNKKGIIKLVF